MTLSYIIRYMPKEGEYDFDFTESLDTVAAVKEKAEELGGKGFKVEWVEVYSSDFPGDPMEKLVWEEFLEHDPLIGSGGEHVIKCEACEKEGKESWMESKGCIGEAGGSLFLYQCPACKTVKIAY